MNLKDWDKLSDEEKQKILSTRWPEPKRAGGCPSGLLELRNSLKLEIKDEIEARSRYLLTSSIMGSYGKDAFADALKAVATEELMHHYVLRAIVDEITEECGE